MDFTQEQQQHIDELIANHKATWQTEQLDPVIAERDELLQYKPKGETEQEKTIKQLQAELRHQKLVSNLEKAGLIDFMDFVNVGDDEEVQGKIDKLNAALEARKLSNNYVPDNHKQTSKYEQAAQKGDTVGMLQAKLNKLFG